MSTDYDCWKEDEQPVSWEEIMEVFDRNADKVKQLLANVILKIK
jgi:5'-methylthioadenosine phosphorylase